MSRTSFVKESFTDLSEFFSQVGWLGQNRILQQGLEKMKTKKRRKKRRKKKKKRKRKHCERFLPCQETG
jgi:hypothetical protein